MRLNKYLSDPYMASKVQWCVAAVPNVAWDKKVFPHLFEVGFPVGANLVYYCENILTRYH